MVKSALCVFILASLLWPVSVESADVNPRLCIPYEKMRNDLWSVYKEKPLGHGISKEGELTQLFISPDGGTWTIIHIKPHSGLACPRAYGTDWFILEVDNDI